MAVKRGKSWAKIDWHPGLIASHGFSWKQLKKKMLGRQFRYLIYN